MRIAKVLRMYSQSDLAKIWKCTVPNVCYKLKHGSITIMEWHLVIKAHPEDTEVLLAALR